MRNILIGLGVLIIIVGALNHYVMKVNVGPGHTSTILGVVGVVVALIGVGTMFMGGKKAA